MVQPPKAIPSTNCCVSCLPCMRNRASRKKRVNDGFTSDNKQMAAITEQSRISNIEQKLASVSSIISIHHHDAANLGSRSKHQIELWLEAEARSLIDKKERYQQKQLRLKQIEDQYEHTRNKKQQHIQHKIIVTSQNKTKNLEGVQKKLLGVASRHQSVISRHRDDESRQLDQQFDQRKSFFLQAERPSSKMSSSSRLSSTSKSRQLKQLPKDEQIEKSIQVINQRLQKAKSTNHERRASQINRIKNHNTTELKEVQERGKVNFVTQQSIFEDKITRRLAQATHNKQQYERSIERKIEEKQKAYSFKLRAYQDNLKSIENQESNKLEELSKKFEQSRSGEKSWKDERGSLYHKKFLANLSLLEQQKVSRADRIIQKHQEISDKNRVYKQRKDSLVKAIKYNPSALT